MTYTSSYLLPVAISHSLPAVNTSEVNAIADLRQQFRQAYQGWLTRSPSPDTCSNYDRDLRQFMAFAGLPADALEALAGVRPEHVAAWRDHLLAAGLASHSVRRKLTVLRSLFSYLQLRGYAGANPAHGTFVKAPAAPRDGKTVGLAPQDCRRLLDAPITSIGDKKTGQELILP